MRRRRQATQLLGYAGPGLVITLVFVELVQATLPLAVITVIGVLVGRVADGSPVALPLAVLSVLLLAQQLLAPLRSAVHFSVTRRVDGEVRSRAMEAACRPAGIAALEDPTTVDLLTLAGGNIDRHWYATPGGAAAAFVALGGRYLQVAAAALILARVSIPVAVGLVAVVVPSFVLCRRWAGLRIRAYRDTHGMGRASRYTSGMANTPSYAKETRMFGLLGWLLDRFGGQWDEIAETRFAASRVAVRQIVVLVAAVAPLVAVAFVVVGRAALDGDPDARGLAVALQAALLIVAILDPRTDDIYQLDFGLAAHDALVQIETTIGGPGGDSGGSRGRDAAGLPSREIRFSGVRFSYSSDEPVLEGLDLAIPAGLSLAVVGMNGAGKTTLVKLLAGLYEPEAGSITVDGIPLGELDLASWRRQLGVIFQDFVRYELPASDNVAFGGLHRAGDSAALDRAAARTGLTDVVGSLPRGWDTPLARHYTGGADLSGGQWQRVALARALFAVEAGARVLVLDEPTANLDVRAEAGLFEEFLGLTTGLTTILISHRFSTVRQADRVCVLDRGQIVEQGTHDDLVAAGGRYAQLFLLQAARFRG
ncbi:MAG TPA: ATP-binding cassette domain-containing protein [Acidimicrobiales bacterium]|nr:ATP-binding cassette domain-containing protein [Acidimicrobiales bacterium]